MSKDPEQLAHLEWLGYVQPVGLVVSTPALLQAQAHVQKNIAPQHQTFLSCLPRDKHDEIVPEIRDFPEFTRSVLGWELTDLIGAPGGEPIPPSLQILVPGYNETLSPTYAVREVEPKDQSNPWLMLIRSVSVGAEFDSLATDPGSHWQATPHAKFERLLREAQVPIGLLTNGTQLRLVYAPRGETSGYATFSVADMAKVAGRPIFAALHMLLCAERLFSLPEKQRLPTILVDSRKYQNVVSTQLAEQVLAALYELLRGFQAANEHRHSELLREVLAHAPNHVYSGLLTVLMRLVFVLYAEDRGLVSNDPVYSNFYSVTGLFDRLRADAGRYPDTMDSRYGAWAQLLTLFRLIYDGGRHGGLQIPARRGYLFDPDRYNFLEGRGWKEARQEPDKVDVPHISDGVIYRVLEKLLVLDGERLSYRTLDVEQIGSVYETIMGFELEVAKGRSIAIKPAKSHGAPATINLDELLTVKPADRAKWVAEHADQKLAGQAAEALKKASTVEELLAALDKKIASNVTPNPVPTGAMIFQPSDERRRSGSHYTPRSLTEPIVRKTLEPILRQLSVDSSQLSEKREQHSSLATDNRQLTTTPTPQQILELKVCDPAMGSGAFLVEACRQLGDELVTAWHAHNQVPTIPPDEDEILHARRLIAQRCIYGVDKNAMAVDLSKLSLWLATLAKDHPFTFLDHSLRCGDSLVGLSREQIAAFHWQPPSKRSNEDVWFGDPIAERMRKVTEYRQRILAARDDKPYEQLRQELDVADEALSLARLTGDCVIAAFFSAGKDRERVAKLDSLARQLVKYLAPQGRIEDRQPLTAAVASLHDGDHPIQPFHWEIEFPEVFTVDAKGMPTGGFDAIVGNPPFAGKNTLTSASHDCYLDWLRTVHEESHGNADLVAHFFRRAFNLLISKGCFGLIATNTIGQGDTRSTGLRWICTHGGDIYAARKRIRWPGMAAVVVSVVHVSKCSYNGTHVLDGNPVSTITAFLFYGGGHEDPRVLIANQAIAFIGSQPYGMGFTFDDTDDTGIANSIGEMKAILASNSNNSQRVFPFIGYAEVANNPDHKHHRFIINFGEMSEDEARQWPDLLELVERKVKPARSHLTTNAIGRKRAEYWWQYGAPAKSLYEKSEGLGRVLVAGSQASAHFAFAFLPTGYVYSSNLTVITCQTYAAFAAIQCSVHEVWSRFFMTTMKDDLVYTPTTCFETYPFTDQWRSATTLEAAGRTYYEFRAALMMRNNEGLTKTYNRFHDPNETSPDILKLRELHAAMDRVVLEAYGWHDLAKTATCEFLLDYEDDEEDEESTSGRARTRKRPWRYRWPDDFRDEGLARLLELNKQRAEAERLAGEAAAAKDAKTAGKPKGSRGKKASNKKSNQIELPGL